MAAVTLLTLVTMVAVVACQVVMRGPVAPGLALALAAMLAAIACAWLMTSRVQGPRSSLGAIGARIAPIVLPVAPALSVVFSLLERRQMLPFAPDWLLVILAFGGLLAACALLPRAPASLVAAGALAAGLGLRLFDFAVIPIDPRRADMVPLVLAALDNLMHGHSPYATYQMPWPVPLTYLPLTWLSYAPALLAGIDPRWTSTACELSLFAVLLVIAGGPRKASSRPLVLLFAAWFPASSLIASDALTAMPVQSLALGASAAMLVSGARRAPLALGLALTTTPLAGALLPLVVLRWSQDGRAALMRRLGVTVAVAAACLLPWILWSPRGFWDGPVTWFNRLDGFPRRSWESSHVWEHVPGFTGLFWRLGLEHLLRPVQIAFVAGVVIVHARLATSSEADGLAGAMVATLLAFLLFNVIIWPYLYEPAVALAFVSLAMAVRKNGAMTGDLTSERDDVSRRGHGRSSTR
jgi:hypothetical protein